MAVYARAAYKQGWSEVIAGRHSSPKQFSWGQPFTYDLVCHEGSLAFDSLSLEFTDDDHDPCNCA